MNVAAKMPLPILALACTLVTAQPDAASQERLAKHADLFRIGTPRGPRLEDMKPDAQGIIKVQPTILNNYGSVGSETLTPAEELAEMAAHVDVIVSGTTVKRYSAPNAMHTALYSDWTVNVTRVFKRSSSIQAEVGSQITVTRIGGDMNLNGHRVIYTDPGFPEFAMDHEYVFYLQSDPNTASFIAISGGTFDIEGTSPLLTAEPKNPTKLRAFSSSSKADFLAAVQRSTTK